MDRHIYCGAELPGGPRSESPDEDLGSVVVGLDVTVATSNAAKLEQVRGALRTSEIACHDLPANALKWHIPEHGDSPVAVATNKALDYHERLGRGRPVLAMDYWLSIDGIPESEQPGAHVRRIPGHPDGASDAEVLQYYIGLCKNHGGLLAIHWTLGLALVGFGDIRTSQASNTRLMVSTPHPNQRPGLPITSLQLDVETRSYINDQTADEERSHWSSAYGPAVRALFDLAVVAPIDPPSGGIGALQIRHSERLSASRASMGTMEDRPTSHKV